MENTKRSKEEAENLREPLLDEADLELRESERSPAYERATRRGRATPDDRATEQGVARSGVKRPHFLMARAYLAEARARRALEEARLSDARRRGADRVTESDPRFQVQAILDVLGPIGSECVPDSASGIPRRGLVGVGSDLVRRASWVARGNFKARLAYDDQVELVLQSGLFDSEFYRRQLGVPSRWTRRRLAIHYLNEGAAGDLNPHPLFDTAYYRKTNPDLAGAGMNLFIHFLSYGSREGRDPHPLFDIEYYRSRVSSLPELDANPLRDYLLRSWAARLSTHQGLSHPLFVDSYYVRLHPEVIESGYSPLEHYVLNGAARRLNPSPLFDVAFYEQQIDLTRTPLRGVFHYLLTSNEDRRDPHPLFQLDHYFTQLVGGRQGTYDPVIHYLTTGGANGFSPHPLFDSAFYWRQVTDAEGYDATPLEHYLAHGRHQLLDTHPCFRSEWYCRQAPEVLEEGGVPLLDYIERGAAAGLDPHPLFATSYYIDHSDDVRRSGANPLVHFVTRGGAEERSPHPLFDTGFYFMNYSDVAESGVNPLVHYLRYGLTEARQPSHLFDAGYYIREHRQLRRGKLTPLEHYVTRGWLRGFDPHPHFSVLYYTEQCPEVRKDGWEPLAHYQHRGKALGLRGVPADTGEYHRWYRRFGMLAPDELRRAKAWYARLQDPPLVSCVLDASGFSDADLERSLRSAKRQIAERWELIVVDGAGREALVRAAGDNRIRYLAASASSSAEGRCAAGLAAAGGEWVWFGTEPSVLSRESIALVAGFSLDAGDLDAGKHCSVLHGDWDRIDAAREHGDPCFVPQWNTELFLARDVFRPAAFYRREHLEQASGGGLAERMVRLMLEGDARAVRRIPRLLVSFAGETAPEALQPVPAPLIAEAREAAERWARSHGYQLTPHEGVPGGTAARPPLPADLPLVSILIPTKDRLDLLRKCVESVLEKTAYPKFEILVIDNKSECPETLEYLARESAAGRIRVLPYPKPYNYSAMNNEAVREAHGSLLCLLNNDIEVISPEWLTDMVRHAVSPGAGAVGARLLYPNDTVQHAGVIIGKNGVAGHSFVGLPRTAPGVQGRAMLTQELAAVTAACMLVPRAVWEEVGGLDETNLSVSFNDIDLCMKIREAGKRIIYAAESELYHYESASIGSAHRKRSMFRFEREVLAFKARWAGRLRDDPFYHPSLSLGHRDYSYATTLRWNAPWNRVPRFVPAPRRERQDPRLFAYTDETNLERSYAVVGSTPRRAVKQNFAPGLSIAILTLNKPELIVPLLDSLVAAKQVLRGQGTAVQILVGDTGSTDGEVLAAYDRLASEVEIVRGMQYQFSRCNNDLFYGVAQHDTVLFLNNDVVFDDAARSLTELMRVRRTDSTVGILGLLLHYPDGSVQHTGIDFFRDGPLAPLCYHPFHARALQEEPAFGHRFPAPAVTGAALLVDSRLFAELGGFDEAYHAECQDVALCLGARRLGYRIEVICAGRVLHLENATREKNSEDWRDRRRLVRKWASFIGVMRP